MVDRWFVGFMEFVAFTGCFRRAIPWSFQYTRRCWNPIWKSTLQESCPPKIRCNMLQHSKSIKNQFFLKFPRLSPDFPQTFPRLSPDFPRFFFFRKTHGTAMAMASPPRPSLLDPRPWTIAASAAAPGNVQWMVSVDSLPGSHSTGKITENHTLLNGKITEHHHFF